MRFLAAILIFAVCLRAEPPAGYYAAADGLTGPALKAALHGIVDGHTVIAYEDLFPPLKALWENPANTSQVTLIYGGAPVAKSSFSWNREHLWPRSRGINPGAALLGGTDDSDLFNVVPADADVNGLRSNSYFDESTLADGNYADPAHPEAPLCSKDANSWEPPAAEKGDIARALFYMAVRYDGTEPDTLDLELVTANPGGPQMANLATLLAWHTADPPDAAERARNDLIFSAYQHNRNPFIDRPEWVAAIWGDTGGGLTVQASASITTATEAPASNAAFAITLSQPAPPGGLVIAFSMSGTAASADFALSGSGLIYNSATGAGTVTLVAGTSAFAITLAPANDGQAEPAESAVLTLGTGADYSVIGGPATVTIRDAPPPAAGGVIASWSFDAVPYPVPNLPPSTGDGTLSTAGWGGSVNSFSGVNGTPALALVGSAGNGTYIELGFSAAGWTALSLSYQTRWSSDSAFDSAVWRWSTDGVNFTPVPGDYAATNTVFEPRTVDLAGIAALTNAPNVKLRLYLGGATSSAQVNNRFDDLVIHGTRYSPAWLARFPTLTPATASADPDADGLSNFAEWAHDLDPLASQGAEASASGSVIAPDPADGGTLKPWPAITFTRRLDAPELAYTPEQSTDLKTWSGGCVLVATAPGPSAESERATYRATIPLSGSGASLRVFLRVRVDGP